MQYFFYEIVKGEGSMPVKAIVHNIDEFELHWHDELEILLVLEGAVNVIVGDRQYLLGENDILLINSNEVHSTRKSEGDNILLALQISQESLSAYYSGFNKIRFDCKSFLNSGQNQESFDEIRSRIAKIVWEVNKKRKGYQFFIGSQVHLLASCLLSNFSCKTPDDEIASGIKNKDADRLKGIMQYINENLDRNISLKEIADREQLSFYYLSHFIQKNLGMSFQKYLNHIRLNKAVRLLTSTNVNIIEIALACGFSGTKAFNRLFRSEYGCSPTDYRKEKYTSYGDGEINAKRVSSVKKKSRTYLDVDRDAALSKLLCYLKPEEIEIRNASPNREEIRANAKAEGIYWTPYWKKLIGFGRAAEGLRRGWQDQLKELQTDIGFEYIRFHGIFSDDMMVFNINESGEIFYNWSYVDELFDFFKEVNIKPFIELGFMPSEIKKSDEKMFHWNANISQPADIRLWNCMLIEFLKHCIARYGLKEVRTWYFEVWNEPDLENVFWVGTKEEYFEFYKNNAFTIKSVDPGLRVGGPSITHQTVIDNSWLDEFIEYCRKGNVPLDFISIHIYTECYSSKKNAQELIIRGRQGENPGELISRWREMRRIYNGKNHTMDTLISADEKRMEMGLNAELHVTEWNATSYGRNLILDTCFIAVFIIWNILKCIGKTNSLCYWTFTDIMEETKAGISPFHGGFGLINRNGVKKASYYAYYFLSMLGDEIIEQREDCIVTRRGDDIQVLAYNYAYFDDFFIKGDTSALTPSDRYTVFEIKPDRNIQLTIEGLYGNYKVTSYRLDREHGSAYDEWMKMGAPEWMDSSETDYLKSKAKPEMVIRNLNLQGSYSRELNIPSFGAQLIIIEKKP